MLLHVHVYSQIRAFAKVALQGPEGLHNVDPDYKGYTLPQSGVEPYIYHESNKDPNELIGQTLFVYMYVTNAVVALIVGIFILPLLLKVYDRAAKKNDKFFRNSTRVQLFMVTLLASVYIGAVYIADMYYYIKISYKYFNLFLILKLLFEVLVLVILLFWCFYIVFNITRCYRTEGEDRKTALARISQIAVVVPLTLTLILVMLSIFPTLLLLFAHPMNTFSLIVIHVALFYTETMAGVLFMDQLYMYKQACTIGQSLRNNGYRRVPEEDIELHADTTEQRNATGTTQQRNATGTTQQRNATGTTEQRNATGTTEQRNATGTTEQRNATGTTQQRNATGTTQQRNTTGTTEQRNPTEVLHKKDNYNVTLLLFGVIGMLIILGFVYLSVMWFYQFLFLRNLSNNLAFDIIIKYIPSVGIAAFGYLIRKGTFSNEKKEDKNEKLWQKLGELKQEIVKLRNISGQPLANHVQHNQDDQPSQDDQLSQDDQHNRESQL